MTPNILLKIIYSFTSLKARLHTLEDIYKEAWQWLKASP